MIKHKILLAIGLLFGLVYYKSVFLDIPIIFDAISLKSGKLAYLENNSLLYVKDYKNDVVSKYYLGLYCEGLVFSSDGRKVAYFENRKREAKKLSESSYFILKILDLKKRSILNFDYKIFAYGAPLIKWHPLGKELYFSGEPKAEPSIKRGLYKFDIKRKKLKFMNKADWQLIYGDINQNSDNLSKWRVVSRKGKLYYNKHFSSNRSTYESVWALNGNSTLILDSKNGIVKAKVISYPESKVLKEWLISGSSDKDFVNISTNPSGTKALVRVKDILYIIDIIKNKVIKPKISPNFFIDTMWLSDEKFLIEYQDDFKMGQLWQYEINYARLRKIDDDMDYEKLYYWSPQISMKNTLPTLNVEK